MKRAIILLTFLVASCAGSAPIPSIHASGKQAWIITCANSLILPSCGDKADEACPGGWVLDSQTKSSTSGSVNPHTGLYQYGSTTYTWKVVCE